MQTFLFIYFLFTPQMYKRKNDFLSSQTRVKQENGWLLFFYFTNFSKNIGVENVLKVI